MFFRKEKASKKTAEPAFPTLRQELRDIIRFLWWFRAGMPMVILSGVLCVMAMSLMGETTITIIASSLWGVAALVVIVRLLSLAPVYFRYIKWLEKRNADRANLSSGRL
ncbi:MAG TPA: hypothetical protein VHC21_02285 [Candidatus Saccharimonadales bacterium]|nr:hypothetical protein [Candidatus Saccharimonadales bacterium]